MIEEQNGRRQASEAKSAAPRHCSSFKPLAVSVRNLERAIAVFALPDSTHASVARLVFDGRASVHTVKAWRIGKRHVAPWAIDLLKTKRDALGAAIDAIKIGPGQSAGWRNVADYRATRYAG